jgi:hypothetical protein
MPDGPPAGEATARARKGGDGVRLEVIADLATVLAVEPGRDGQGVIAGFNHPTYRGMRVNGQRIATWSSDHGWSGDGRPDAEWVQ